MNLNAKAVREVLKSAGRFLYFGGLGLVSALLVSLAADTSLASSYVEVAGVNLPVGLLIVSGVGYVAKIVDRYKKYDPATPSNGIAPEFLQK